MSDKFITLEGLNTYNTELQTKINRLINEAQVGKVDYLGTVSSMSGLSTTSGKGDFYRVEAQFDFGSEKAHVGDILIALKDEPSQNTFDWDLIHTEIDSDTWVANSKTAAGYVAKGEGNANAVWMTDGEGNPAWREAPYVTREDIPVDYVKQEEFNHVVTELTEDYFTITSSYNERTTADGKKIANGDYALLEKVEGNTIVSGKDENGMNGTITNAVFSGIRSYGVNLTDGKVQDSPTGVVYKRLYLKLPLGQYTVVFEENTYMQGYGSSVKKLKGNIDTRFHIEIISEDESNQWINFRLDPNGLPWDATSKIAIYEGLYEIDNIQPYVDGGVDDFVFPSIEMPLGRAIDFVNKKILDYSVKVELTGNEYCWKYTGLSQYPNSIGLTCLKSAESYAYGVSTDCEVIRSTAGLAPNTLILGQQATAVYFIDVLTTLGMTEVSEFKAYLKQRYENGNPVTIYYVASTLQSEEPFNEEELAAGNKYKAWDDGQEVVIGNSDVNCTLMQKYNTSIFSRLDNLEKQVNDLFDFDDNQYAKQDALDNIINGSTRFASVNTSNISTVADGQPNPLTINASLVTFNGNGTITLDTSRDGEIALKSDIPSSGGGGSSNGVYYEDGDVYAPNGSCLMQYSEWWSDDDTHIETQSLSTANGLKFSVFNDDVGAAQSHFITAYSNALTLKATDMYSEESSVNMRLDTSTISLSANTVSVNGKLNLTNSEIEIDGGCGSSGNVLVSTADGVKWMEGLYLYNEYDDENGELSSLYLSFEKSDDDYRVTLPLNIVADYIDINANLVKMNNECRANTFYATSDARKKENIVDYVPENSILDLPVKEFNFIGKEEKQIGCLAQDLQQLFPNLVKEDDEGYLSIQENKLVYLLLDEVKKLKAEVEKLKGE